MAVEATSAGAILFRDTRGRGISTDETNRLRGRETVCDGCGHELEFYFY